MRTVLLVLFLAAWARADTLAAYGTRVWASPGGSFVIETKEVRGGGIDYVIKSKGGRTRGKGRIDHMPIDLTLFEDGTGFVVWGRYMRDGRGTVVARYDFDGTVRWKHDFKKIFDAEQIKAFPRTLAFVFWARSIWNDPTRGEIIGTTSTQLVLKFNTRTGEIRPGGMDAVLDSLKIEPPPLAGIDAAAEWYPDRAREQLVKIARTPKYSVRVRVAAAAGAGRQGDYARLWRDALDDKFALERAVKAATTVLSRADALEFLERAGTRKGAGLAAIQQLAALGATAQLLTVLSHGDTPAAERAVVARVLKGLPKADVIKGILDEFDDADLDTAVVMLDTLIAVGGKSLPRRLQPHQQKLIKLLGRKGANVIWLAQYFSAVPTTEAVQPLHKAARRLRGKRIQQNAVFEALRKCTGLQIGDSLAEWDRALKR